MTLTKDRIVKDWNAMRWVRLGVGILILGSGIDGEEWAPIILGSVLLVQALLNVGCATCAGGSCRYAAEQMTRGNAEANEYDSAYMKP